MALLLLRHGSAGDRRKWKGDDNDRPLDQAGRQQAAGLVARLATYPLDRILTSPARRCVETVEPTAAAFGLPVEVRAELSEARQVSDGRALVRSLTKGDVLVCGHGGLETALPESPRWRKGCVLVVNEKLRVTRTIGDP